MVLSTSSRGGTSAKSSWCDIWRQSARWAKATVPPNFLAISCRFVPREAVYQTKYGWSRKVQMFGPKNLGSLRHCKVCSCEIRKTPWVSGHFFPSRGVIDAIARQVDQNAPRNAGGASPETGQGAGGVIYIPDWPWLQSRQNYQWILKTVRCAKNSGLLPPLPTREERWVWKWMTEIFAKSSWTLAENELSENFHH